VDPDDGPILVTVEYFIAAENVARFRELMHEMRERRLRDGARRWRLYQDAKQPDRFIELYRLDSWGEHLRQHERVTMEDIEVVKQALALHAGTEKPKVTHYFGLED